MLLINSKNNKIDVNCEENEKVNKLYVMIVSFDKRKNEINCFNRETIFVHDIDFFDVVNNVIDVEKTTNFVEINENDKIEIKDDDIDDIDNINIKNVDENETSEINEDVVVNFSNFVCFSRT